MFSFKKIIFIFTLVLLFSVQSQSVFSGDFNYKYFFDGNSYGFKDSLGNIVIPAKFDYAEKFSEGLANVQIGNDIGRINTQAVVVYMENNNNSSNTYTQPTYNKPKEKDFKPYIACESECKMNRDNSYIDCSIL